MHFTVSTGIAFAAEGWMLSLPAVLESGNKRQRACIS
ncbi:MAG: hypothetical protein ACI9JD_004250, partial [Rhodococcus sp. (in: high G+C Gram-positive bacteria)]